MTSSLALIKVSSPAKYAIWMASEVHRLQNLDPAWYGFACLTIDHFMLYFKLSLFNFHISLLNSVAFSFAGFLKLCTWFLYLTINLFAVRPKYL